VRRLSGNIGICSSELERGVLVEIARERQGGAPGDPDLLVDACHPVRDRAGRRGGVRGARHWQIARLHEKPQFNAAVRAGLGEPPRPLADLVPADVDPDSVRFRRVTATGTYDPENQVELYGRTQDGRPGSHLLTPLVTDYGLTVIVDRGWIPLGLDPSQETPPTGQVQVDGVLFASEGDPPGQVGSATERVDALVRVDLARIQDQLPYRIAPVYVLLQERMTTEPGELPLPAALPELSEEPHLSYALQWFTFATIAMVGFVIVALREGRGSNAAVADDLG
jgi:surfeit locus 1 family protein